MKRPRQKVPDADTINLNRIQWWIHEIHELGKLNKRAEDLSSPVATHVATLGRRAILGRLRAEIDEQCLALDARITETLKAARERLLRPSPPLKGLEEIVAAAKVRNPLITYEQIVAMLTVAEPEPEPEADTEDKPKPDDEWWPE